MPPIETAASDERAAIRVATTPQVRFALFSALVRYPTFRRLWLGATAASLGQWMQSTALGWLALDLTDSKSFVGLVALMAGLPFLLVSVPAGVLIDRFDRRRVLMMSQALAATLACFVAFDVMTGWVQPWHLLLAAFLNGSLQAILSPTQQSLVPRLVARDSLTNAVGLMSAGQNMTRVVGPSIAGATIGFIGTGEAFLLQAAALVTALWLIGTARFPTIPRQTSTLDLRGMLDGFKIVSGRQDLRALFLLACIPTFFVFPYISFLTVFARDILKIGPAGLGILMAASGSGAVIGALMVASGRRRDGAGRALIANTVLYGVVIVAVALSRTVYLTLPLLVITGLLGAYFMSSNNVLLQHRITDDVRGRVMGTYMLTFGLMPLGAMPMGLLADHLGTPTAVATGAILSSVFAAGLGVASKPLREL
jgi:MFS family permease